MNPRISLHCQEDMGLFFTEVLQHQASEASEVPKTWKMKKSQLPPTSGFTPKKFENPVSNASAFGLAYLNIAL